MFRVALCNCPNSKNFIEKKIAAFFGTSDKGYIVSEFDKVEDLLTSEVTYDVYFLNRTLLGESMETIIENVEKRIQLKSGKKKYSFASYVDDPVSEDDCTVIIDCIRRYLAYDSMYFAIELLTDKGLRSIAISKIVFFEFHERKVKIKTHNNEYLCNDTLQNVMSLVGSYDFYQPHKSFIVNLKHIVCIKNYAITMNDGSMIPLSQKRSRNFRDLYENYLERNMVKVKKRTLRR